MAKLGKQESGCSEFIPNDKLGKSFKLKKWDTVKFFDKVNWKWEIMFDEQDRLSKRCRC